MFKRHTEFSLIKEQGRKPLYNEECVMRKE
jgi:hypothetical protein